MHEGEQIGNYRLVRLLGRGGFAEVYLGEHIHLGTQVAIKILRIQMERQDVQGFINEAKTISKLRHPHIIRLIDFGLDSTTVYLIMEYAPQGALRDRYPHGWRVPLPEVVEHVKQVGAALQYAHDQGVVHRDIKPENMLIDASGSFLLSDFGIAIPAHKTQSLSTQDAAGSAPYMAPEQMRGKARPASDQYSRAVVTYEWLCGTRPFEGSTAIEIALKHITQPPPPLCQHIPSLPFSVEQVVMKALAKEPGDRFSSVQEFMQALEVASSGQTMPVSASASAPAQVPPPYDANATILIGQTPPSEKNTIPLILSRTEISPENPNTNIFVQKNLISPPQTISSDIPTLLTPLPKKRSYGRRVIVTSSILLMLGLILFTLLPHWWQSISPNSTCGSPFSGTFQNTPDSKWQWQWIDPGQDTVHSLTGQGQLQISIYNPHKDLYPPNYDAPRLLQPITGDFTIETRVHFTPNAEYEGAGLLIWQDTNTYVLLERSFGGFSGLEFDQNAGSYVRLSSAFGIDSGPHTMAPVVDLRLQRRKDTIVAWWRDVNANQSWQQLAAKAAIHFTTIQVGLILAAQKMPSWQMTLPVTASYDYFNVTCP